MNVGKLLLVALNNTFEVHSRGPREREKLVLPTQKISQADTEIPTEKLLETNFDHDLKNVREISPALNFILYVTPSCIML